MLKKIFIDSNFILLLITLNSVLIFAQECGATYLWVSIIDLIFTVIFLGEIFYKNAHYGIKTFWCHPMNTLDALLVILSIPSVINFIVPIGIIDLSFLLVLRVLRVLRIFRIIRLFPDFEVIVRNFMLALKQSSAFLLSFFILIIIFALIDCSMFREVAPQYFSTPFEAIYSTFRMFSVEGWYEIPAAVVAGLEGEFWRHVIRLYFCIQLLFGGIVGMSLINAIFVDAMVSDNNDDLKRDVAEIRTIVEKQNQEVRQELNAIRAMLSQAESSVKLSKDNSPEDAQPSHPGTENIGQELAQIRAMLEQMTGKHAQGSSE